MPDPIYKIVCGRLPIAGEDLLASQPTISRFENQVQKQDTARMRSAFVDGFAAQYRKAPSLIVLDIDGWADPTHGGRWLSVVEANSNHLLLRQSKMMHSLCLPR